MNVATVGEESILSLIHQVLSGEVTLEVTDEVGAKLPKIPIDYKVVGTAGPRARIICAIVINVADEVTRRTIEHDKSHDLPDHCPASCKAHMKYVNTTVRRVRTLKDVCWETIFDQFPTIVEAGPQLCQNWDIVVPRGIIPPETALFDENHPSSNFVDDLTKILRGVGVGDVTAKLEEIKEGEEVLAYIEDEVLRNLVRFEEQLRDLTLVGAPKNFERDDPAMEEWAKNLTFVEAAQIQAKNERLCRQADIVQRIFWTAVRETIPAVDGVPTIAIRDGWKIVKMPRPSLMQALDDLMGDVVGG